MRYYEIKPVKLFEGPHDPHIFKAVLMAGSPGSGKSLVNKTIFAGTGLRNLNVDDFYLLKKKLDKTTGNIDKDYERSWTKYKKLDDIYRHSRLGMIVDGTGKNSDVIFNIKMDLEDLGYDVAMIYVDVSLDTALKRVKERSKDPKSPDFGRVTDPEFVKQTWNSVRDNQDIYKELFGKQFYYVDSEKYDREGIKIRHRSKGTNQSFDELKTVEKSVNKWLNKPPSSTIAKEWLANPTAAQKDVKQKPSFRDKISPGQRKGISLKIEKFEKLLKKIHNLKAYDSSLPDDVPEEIANQHNAIKQDIINQINSLNSQLDGKDKKNGFPAKFYNFMQGVSKQCSKIVQLYMSENGKFNSNDAKVFYRGIKSHDDALVGKPFNRRRPKDSDSNLSKIFNNRMAEAGFEARRDNSTFVTGNKMQADGYGQLYVIFPFDGFNFSWSKNVSDMVLGPEFYKNLIDDEKIKPLIKYIENNKENLGKYGFDFYDLLGTYRLNNTLKAAKSAISAGDIPTDFEQLTKLENIITPESVVSGFQLDKTDLSGALRSKNEVNIRGEYYAIKASFMNDIMKFFEEKAYPEGKPKVIKSGIFNPGDRVTVKTKGNHYYGLSGEVQYVYNHYDEVSVKLDGENWTNDFKIKDIKHESEADSETDNDKIKKGDKVKIIGKHPNTGDIATVTDVYDSFKDTTLELDNGKKLYDVPLASLEKVGSAPKSLEIGDVKNGDKVMIIGNHKYTGKTGEVSYAYSTKPLVDVEFDNKVAIDVPLKNIEKIKAEAENPNLIDAAYEVTMPGLTPLYQGQFLTQNEYDQAIDEYGDDTFTVKKLDNPDKNDPDLNLDNLKWEPEPEVKTPKQYSEGDKVKIIGTHNTGKTGTITQIQKSGNVIVKLDDSDDKTFLYPSEIEKIKTSEPEVIPVHSFKQGDSVKVIDGPAAGKTGKIAHVGNIMKIADVTFSDGSTKYIGFKQLQLLDFPIQDIAKKKTPLKDLPAVQQLIKSAAQSNQVTVDQLDQAIGTLNPTSQEIEELMAYIANIGMEIVDSNSF
jgi:ribosomal protein L24/adenylate kinase family enzyme